MTTIMILISAVAAALLGGWVLGMYHASLDQQTTHRQQVEYLQATIARKDAELRDAYESMARAQGHPFKRSDADQVPSKVVAGPRWMATKPFPPVVEKSIRGE